ncbi:MAG: hypothetical protein U1F54_10190 [Burkholderiales bacterium]
MTAREGHVNARAWRFNPRTSQAAVAFCFAAGAAIGAFFVLAGPVPFVRGLGLVALAAGIGGCAVHIHLSGARASAVLRAWRQRAAAAARTIGAAAASPPGAALLRPRAASR